MCGICGAFAPNLVESEANIFWNLLYTSALRGDDSTGIFTLRSNGGKKHNRFYLAKDATPPAYFIPEHLGMAKADGNWRTHMLVGHARAATIGKVTKANAHPFDMPNIIGCHNGTTKFKDADKPDVTDSEVIMRMISETGIDNTIKEMAWGDAYALVWLDKRDSTLNIIRNGLRPMSWVKTTSQVVYFASEGKMLDWIVDRSHLTKEGDVHNCEVDTMYTWRIGPNMSLKPDERKIERPAYKGSTYSYGSGYGHGGMGGGLYDDWGWSGADQEPRGHRVGVGPEDRSSAGLVAIKENDGDGNTYWTYVSWCDPDFKHVPDKEGALLLPFDKRSSADANKNTNNTASAEGRTTPSGVPAVRNSSRNATVGRRPRCDDPGNDNEESDELFYDEKSNLYTEDEVYEILGMGCANCGDIPDFDDIVNEHNELNLETWVADSGHRQFLCHKCSKEGFHCHGVSVH